MAAARFRVNAWIIVPVMRTLLSWSTGKDSAWALHVLRQRPDVEVVGLVTTINAAFDRVAMHGVRRALLEAQAEAAGLPLHVLAIPYPCPNADVRAHHGRVRGRAGRGRASRPWRSATCSWRTSAATARRKLAGTGIAPLFPLWGIDTGRLAREMIAGGLEAHVTCVDPRKLPASFAGRRFDARAAGGPAGGRRPLRRERRVPHLRLRRARCSAARSPVEAGEVVTRDGFVFCDLMPSPHRAPSAQMGRGLG